MRVLHRLTAVLGIGALILSGTPIFAQSPAPAAPGAPPSFLEQMPSMPLNAQPVPYSGNALPPYPPGAQFPPSSFTASLTDPEYSGYPAAIPPSPPMPSPNAYGPTINPYPTISPFDFSFSNTFNFGGLWNRKEETKQRQYYFKADALFMQTRQPHGIFGNDQAQSYTRQVRDFLNSQGSSSSSSSSSTTTTTTGTTGTTTTTTGTTTSTGTTTTTGTTGTTTTTTGTTSSSSSTGGSTQSNATSQLFLNEGIIVQTPAYEYSLFNNYNAVNLTDLKPLPTEGGRFTFGWWNPDSSGFAANVWFGGVATDNFNAADLSSRQQNDLPELIKIIHAMQSGQVPGGVIDDIAAFVDLSGRFSPTQIFEQNLLNLRGLPVGDNTVRGQTIPYDIYFGIRTQSQQIGTGLDYYMTPLFDHKWLTVSPSVGFKYMNIQEHLGFLGIDSGLLYGSPSGSSGSSTGGTTGGTTAALVPGRDYKAQSIPNNIDDDHDGIVDNAVVLEPIPGSSTTGTTGGTTGGTSGSSSSSSGGTALVTFPSPFALLPATIDIGTNTNVFGPDAGLRYQIGSPDFHLIGETKFGLLANFEKITLSGNNIGSTTRVNGNIVQFPAELTASTQSNPRAENNQDLIIPTPDNPNPNAFSETQSHVHMSPMIEQSLIMEGKVFDWVPVINHCWPFRGATFRAGYTFIWLGSVIATNDSVFYQGDPMAGLFPKIEPKHESWWTGNWNVGLSWDF